LTKIVIEIHLVNSLGTKLVAKVLEKSIKNALNGAINHPAIEKIESKVE